MNAPAIELYNVIDEGELTQLPITGPIKDMLNSEMVVLLVDEATKRIYLWKGAKARVRRKFIAARVSQDLRGKKGLSFKVESIDQGDEPAKFIQIIGGPVAVAVAAAAPQAAPAGGMASTQAPVMQPQQFQAAPTIQAQPTIQPQQFQAAPTIQTQPAPTIQAQPVTVAAAPGEISVPPNIEEGVKAIIYEIEKRPPPPPYNRELVFIGPYAFSIAETKKSSFGQEQVERRWELAAPPEGQFIAQGYTPRAIIQGGKVLAVELMKGGEGGASPDTQIVFFKIKYQK